ncbi:hypothetical protein OPT61_g4676 [Boeremia exigua]|uniref:Uncharacterized protein n=1 Tax=Boeremia exigua TaxID=749465 RepID=A0ACC2ID73_9PLEO|nr:hypothetical protein OPT61_g4676 [Boeremia exigua]
MVPRLAFCESSELGEKGEQIEVIHNWPSQHTKIGTKEKVPSEITYQVEGLVWDSLIPPQADRHIWTKLQLDSPQGREEAKIFRELSRSSQSVQKPPVDIVADYLAQVKTHLIETLDQKYGKTLWRSLSVTLVVTVPAVWSDLAKDRTLQAVDKAGPNKFEFPQLSQPPILTTEPEAAALYTIKTLRLSVQGSRFAANDGFIMCDMGGGTIDLISYRVTTIDPVAVEEVTIGCGDQCGGSFVDRAFFKWLEMKLGTMDFLKISDYRSDNMPRTSLPKKLARMLQDFTLEVKSGFSGTETNFIRLPSPLFSLPDDEGRGIHEGEIKITAEDMISMFEFPLRRTYELLGEQLQKAKGVKKVNMKYVFMVGGFSESPYIFQKVTEFVENAGLQTIRPSYPWSAVARGVVCKGLEGDIKAVTNRKCRRHYGTSCNQVFDQKEHREIDSYMCPFDGTKRASDQMKWLLKRGDNLATSKSSHANSFFRYDFWPAEKRECDLTLYSSDEAKAPKRLEHKGVKKLASVRVDLSVIPKGEWTKKRSPSNAPYYSLSFSLEIAVQSSLEFSLVVNGKSYGSVRAAYE